MSSLVDCLLLAERKHLQSDIKENNFSTCTLKVDIMDNSSDNSFSDRLKGQDLRDLGENPREDQPATSLKCLEPCNTQKEETTDSLNSEVISNIKRKVLTSACLMARKHSKLLHKGCCLEKDEKDKFESAGVNDGAAVPQNLKEHLRRPSPRDKEHLTDMHHNITSVASGGINNTLSPVTFSINGVSSNCHNKVATDGVHATGQSVVDCSEVLGPSGLKCSENCSTGLKQRDKTHAAVFSEVVAENQGSKLVYNNENHQAAACNNVAVENAKELLDCIDDTSLNEVISEDKQAASMYSSTKSKHKRKSSRNLNACSLNLGFGGFQTASNKKIKFSEDSIAKGRMLFKDIENEYFEISSDEKVQNFSNQVQKESKIFSGSESKMGSNLPDSLTSQTCFLEPRDTQIISHKAALYKSFPGSQQSLQETNQTLTASQEAEIAELSSILEETGSQFEFTQFRKQSDTTKGHIFQQFGTVEKEGFTNVENTSETREGADFYSTLKSEIKKGRYCTKQEDVNKDSKVVEYEKGNAVVFNKNNEKMAFAKLDRNEGRVSNGSFPAAGQDSFSDFVGFTSAGGKKITISKEALTRSAELFRDLDDDKYLLTSSETSIRCHGTNRHMSSNCNFARGPTKGNKGKKVCVSDFKTRTGISHLDSISHSAQKENEENISTLFKEGRENETKISNDNENVIFSSTNTIINGLSSIKKHYQNPQTSKRVLNQGDGQVEGSFQEDSLDVACLDDVTTTAERHSLSDKMESLFPNQKGEDRKENEHWSQKWQTPAAADVSISDAALAHSLHLFSVPCGERDVNVSENSDTQKTTCENMEREDATHDKNLCMNESKIKTDSSHCDQTLFQQVCGENNEVKGSYLTGFHTASGKKITVADEFLGKAKQFFAEDVDVGREHNDNFENLTKKKRCGKNCVKDCDLCIESISQCDPEELNRKLVPEEPGSQFKQVVEDSPIKCAVILDTIKSGRFVNLGDDYERNLVTSYMHKKAVVRPGQSEFESLSGQESHALSRTHLSEDGKLFPERETECLPKKRGDSENMRDLPVQSDAYLHVMEVSNDPEDNSVPGHVKSTLFVEDGNSKSNQSLILTLESNSLNCDHKGRDLEHLNKRCADTNHFANTIVNACQNQSLISLTEDQSNLTRLKETTLTVENQKGDLKQIVFSTAKGETVPVSESALARVRQMFKEDYSKTLKYEIETNSKTNQSEIAGNSSSVIHAEYCHSAKSLNAVRSEESNSPASHIKVNASASENYHQDRNTVADTNSVLNSQRQHFQQNMKPSGPMTVADKQTKQLDSCTSNLGFFSTASGKPVQLSEESLRRARQLFAEMEGNQSSNAQETFLSEKNVEKSKMHTEVVPGKMQMVLPKGEENSSTELISAPAFGFSTASGKQVTVSKSAYQKAKAILKESDFLSSELCITDQLDSTKESGQHVKSLTDGMASESQIQNSCNEDSDLKSIYPKEAKSFPSAHLVKMPEFMPNSKRNKQLSIKNNCQQEETRPLRKGQLNLEMRTEDEVTSCSATAKAEINILQTPKNYLDVEAVESARAFMEDSLSDSGIQTNTVQSFSGRLDKSFGKRRIEEQNLLGRSLLYICSTPYFFTVGCRRSFLGHAEVKDLSLGVNDRNFCGRPSFIHSFQA